MKTNMASATAAEDFNPPVLEKSEGGLLQNGKASGESTCSRKSQHDQKTVEEWTRFVYLPSNLHFTVRNSNLLMVLN